MSVQKEHCPDCGKDVTVSGLYFRESPKVDGEWKPKYVRLPGAWRCSKCGFIHLSEDDALRVCMERIETAPELALVTPAEVRGLSERKALLRQDVNEGKVE